MTAIEPDKSQPGIENEAEQSTEGLEVIDPHVDQLPCLVSFFLPGFGQFLQRRYLAFSVQAAAFIIVCFQYYYFAHLASISHLPLAVCSVLDAACWDGKRRRDAVYANFFRIMLIPAILLVFPSSVVIEAREAARRMQCACTFKGLALGDAQLSRHVPVERSKGRPRPARRGRLDLFHPRLVPGYRRSVRLEADPGNRTKIKRNRGRPKVKVRVGLNIDRPRAKARPGNTMFQDVFLKTAAPYGQTTVRETHFHPLDILLVRDIICTCNQSKHQSIPTEAVALACDSARLVGRFRSFMTVTCNRREFAGHNLPCSCISRISRTSRSGN